MPWEVTIINGSVDAPKPLGDRAAVIAAFAEALPEAPLGPAPLLPADIIDGMPEFVRDEMRRPKLGAVLMGDGFSIEFHGYDAPVVDSLGADVRGNGDPIPALASLCASRGWLVVDDANRSPVNLAGRTGAWQSFRKWRDKAIRVITGGGTAGE